MYKLGKESMERKVKKKGRKIEVMKESIRNGYTGGSKRDLELNLFSNRQRKHSDRLLTAYTQSSSTLSMSNGCASRRRMWPG